MATYTDRDSYGMYRNLDASGPGPALMGADTLIGDDVVNGQEESLGDLKEIMIDMRSGHVAYAVLAFGGFLGIGEKLFAVPWQALHLDTVNKRFVLNVSKEKLVNAPGFDKDRWPDMTDATWQENVHEFYGTEPYSSGGAGLSGGIGGPAVSGGVGAGTRPMGAGHAGASAHYGSGSLAQAEGVGGPGSLAEAEGRNGSSLAQSEGRGGRGSLADSEGLSGSERDGDVGTGSITGSTYRERE